MPATAAWLASAEALLNRCIDSSAQALGLARRLQGTSLQIDIEGIARILEQEFAEKLGSEGQRLAHIIRDSIGNLDASIAALLDRKRRE